MNETRPENDKPHNIWEGYDADEVKRALRRAAGALRGVNREALLKDIRASRGQDSRGRPT